MIHFPILYIEDDNTTRDNIYTMLNRRFSNLHVAKNGLVGLDLYHKISPRVIIVDLKMPIMGGLELIQEVRKIDPHIHIIVTSAHSDKEDLLSAINLNVNHYLIKPININALLTLLNEEYGRYRKTNKIVLSSSHTYDLDKKIHLKNNRPLKLTKTENDILHLLVTNPNALIDYNRLEIEVWKNIPMTKYTLRTHVMQLRKKLGNEISIKNFSGQGYMLIFP